ncbi:hypothetical protein GCM10007304_17610 [Rhodococcoides trifolii]|uniref:Uncharacterized protein n=1 Tax=Rhodococcoides trifolii TaxID=908250 RepID=A0A917D1C7_9NOCA|nr:hypothetical protein [Rhodococcus trifolii]GGG03941.1 hypothetical protein GCM10007304_17610 [Rhodococcus trifolii]
MTITVRAECTTTEFDEGVVFDIERDERVDNLIRDGRLSLVEDVEAKVDAARERADSTEVESTQAQEALDQAREKAEGELAEMQDALDEPGGPEKKPGRVPKPKD